MLYVNYRVFFARTWPAFGGLLDRELDLDAALRLTGGAGHNKAPAL